MTRYIKMMLYKTGTDFTRLVLAGRHYPDACKQANRYDRDVAVYHIAIAPDP